MKNINSNTREVLKNIPSVDLIILDCYKSQNISFHYSLLKKIIKDEIKQNKKNSKIMNLIELPEFISNSKSLYFQEHRSKLGNYVTTKVSYGQIVQFKKVNNYNFLNGKIVLLENADPGYDFIFSYNIKGLITEYGGANSHMSIRCLEFGIPAIIGIGSKEFKRISMHNSIEINSNQKYYKILN